jgi:hypothetical protein
MPLRPEEVREAFRRALSSGRGGPRVAARSWRRSARVGALALLAGALPGPLRGGGATPPPHALDATEFQVNSATADFQYVGAAAAGPDGGYVVVWTHLDGPSGDGDGSSIRARRYRADGSALDAADFQVNTTTAGNQGGPDVAVDGLGNAIFVWIDGANGVRARRFASAGGALDAVDFAVNSTATAAFVTTAVAADLEGTFVVAWDSLASAGDALLGVRARRFGADGAPLAADFLVNGYTTGIQAYPDVGVDAAGRFVVAWQTFEHTNDTSGASIQRRRFGANGAALDATDQLVNSYTTSDQTAPAVAVAPDGRFVVAFASAGSSAGDTSSTSVHARRFGADGAPAAASFQVNSATTGEQEAPAVGIDAAGNFVVAFHSDAVGGDLDLSVQARRYRASGTIVDAAQFRVNELVAGAQGLPSVAVGANGDFAVAWESAVSGGNDSSESSIQARRYGRPTIAVDPGALPEGTGCTLADAIASANASAAVGGCAAGNAGGVIELPPGAAIELGAANNGANALPVVFRPVTIRGHGATVSRGPGLGCPASPEMRLFEVGSGGVLELEELTVANGCVPAAAGGAVLVSAGALLLDQVTVADSRAANGGGVHSSGAVRARRSWIADDDAGSEGGGIWSGAAGSVLELRDSTVSGGGAAAGGGLYLGGTALLSNVTVSNNAATSEGAGIDVATNRPRVTIEHATIAGNNLSDGVGVGEALQIGSGTVRIHDSLVGDSVQAAVDDCSTFGADEVAASGRNLDTDSTCALLFGGAFETVEELVLALADNGGPTPTHLPFAASPALDAAPACATRAGAALTRDQRGYPRPTDDDGVPGAACDLGAVERGPLFLDGFAAGDTGAWSAAVP